MSCGVLGGLNITDIAAAERTLISQLRFHASPIVSIPMLDTLSREKNK
jgi:hypothetical protein